MWSWIICCLFVRVFKQLQMQKDTILWNWTIFVLDAETTLPVVLGNNFSSPSPPKRKTCMCMWIYLYIYIYIYRKGNMLCERNCTSWNLSTCFWDLCCLCFWRSFFPKRWPKHINTCQIHLKQPTTKWSSRHPKEEKLVYWKGRPKTNKKGHLTKEDRTSGPRQAKKDILRIGSNILTSKPPKQK